MMNGLLGPTPGQMTSFPNHHPHYGGGGGGNTAHHFGQMYTAPQRSSFAIQELLGLSSCRQAGHSSSPDLLDTGGAVPGTLPGMYHLPALGAPNPSMAGSHRVDAQTSSFLREQPLATGGGGGGSGPPGSSFCPWRFDPLTSQSHVPQGMTPGAAPRFSGVSRHGEDLSFGYKHNIADDGECILYSRICNSCSL